MARIRSVIEFIRRMNPLVLEKRTVEQTRLNGESVERANRAAERRMDLIRAEAKVRSR